MYEFSNDDAKQIYLALGKLEQSAKEHNKQLTKVFTKLDEMPHNCMTGQQLKEQVDDHLKNHPEGDTPKNKVRDALPVAGGASGIAALLYGVFLAVLKLLETKP